MKYIIFSPPYQSSSGGVRALYELQKHLIRAGEDAIVVNSFIGTFDEDDIAVYPEVQGGNLAGLKKVIRWVLYYPGQNGGDKEFDKAEKIVTWSKQYYDAPVLAVPIFEPFFKNEGLKREFDAYWAGRGNDTGYRPSLNYKNLTYDWPKTRKELAELLNKTKTLYVFSNSALIYEAQLCGCDVKFINPDNAIIDIPFKPIFENFEEQFKEFLKLHKD